MNNTINYDALLESFDYDQERIKKYFNNIISSLESEAFSLKEKKFTEIENKYKSIDNVIEQYNKIKETIIKDYLNDFKNANESYNEEILSIDNKYLSQKNEILDFIDLNNDKIKKIKNIVNMQLYDAKKPYESKIQLVIKHIEEDYFKEADFIFQSKEKLLSNNDFYLRANRYLNEIDKTLNFFSDLNLIGQTIESNNVELNNDDIINKFKSLSSFISDESYYQNETQSIESFKINNNLLYNNILSKLESLKTDEDKLYDGDIKTNIELSKYDLSNFKNINKVKKLLNKVNDKRETNAFIYKTINEYFFKQEENILTRFKDLIISFDKETNNELVNSLSSFTSSLDATLENTIKTINSIIKSAEDTNDNINSFKILYNEKLNDLNKQEISTNINLLKQLKNYVSNLINSNKKLDAIAFELLTSKEVLKLKLMDLKKELLTIDDKTQMKSIDYEYKIKELDQTFDLTSSIINSKAELKLLENDILIDKKIKLNALSKDLYTLELKKNIDILRSDYMVSYSKLNTIKEISESIKDYDKNISLIESKINLEKATQNMVIEAINNKFKYDELINTYNDKISMIENHANQKTRYLNDILEIERDNFTKNKEKARQVALSIEKMIYPEILKEKSLSSKQIMEINKEIDKSISNIEEKAELAKTYKNDLLDKGQVIYKDFLIYLKSFYKLKYEDGIDRSSSLTMVLSNFKNYVKNLNQLLQVFNNRIIFEDKKLLNASSFYLNNIAFNSDNKSTRGIINLAKEYYIEFKKKINKNKIFNESELKNKIDKLNKTRKIKIAKVVLNNTLKIDGYLNDLDKVKESNLILEKKFEDKVGEFKSIYLSTLDSIKVEYDKKIKDLNTLKVIADTKSTTLNEDMNSSFKKELLDSLDQSNISISNIEENNINNQKNIENTINFLNFDMDKKNKKFDEVNAQKENEKQEFFNNISEEAKKLYKDYEDSKIENTKIRKKLILEKEKNKEFYVGLISKQSFEFKNNYEKKKQEIQESMESQTIDSQIEYSKLLNDSIELLTSNSKQLVSMINKYKDSTNLISTSISSSIDELTSKNIKNLSNESDK